MLEDIDKLYPKDEVKGMDASNRFVLLWNYYKKIGDTRKAKELINEAKNNPEIDKEDEPVKSIISAVIEREEATPQGASSFIIEVRSIGSLRFF